MKVQRIATLALAIATAGVLARTSHAALTLVDDFSQDTVGNSVGGTTAATGGTWTYTTFNPTGGGGSGTIVADPAGSGNNVLQMTSNAAVAGGGSQATAMLPLIATSGATATLFFQMYAITSPIQGSAVGMDTSNNTNTTGSPGGWAAAYVTQELGGSYPSPPVGTLISHSGTTAEPLIGTGKPNADLGSTWYDMWIVLHVSTDPTVPVGGVGGTPGTYDAYVALASNPTTILGSFTGGTNRAINPATASAYNELQQLVIQTFNETGQTSGVPNDTTDSSVTDVANFYFDATSDDHGVNPLAAPEPASLSLLGLGVVGLMARRRRGSK